MGRPIQLLQLQNRLGNNPRHPASKIASKGFPPKNRSNQGLKDDLRGDRRSEGSNCRRRYLAIWHLETWKQLTSRLRLWPGRIILCASVTPLEATSTSGSTSISPGLLSCLG